MGLACVTDGYEDLMKEPVLQVRANLPCLQPLSHSLHLSHTLSLYLYLSLSLTLLLSLSLTLQLFARMVADRSVSTRKELVLTCKNLLVQRLKFFGRRSIESSLSLTNETYNGEDGNIPMEIVTGIK
jgi:hypothetical protein